MSNLEKILEEKVVVDFKEFFLIVEEKYKDGFIFLEVIQVKNIDLIAQFLEIFLFLGLQYKWNA